MSRISDLAAHCIRCGFCLESCPTFLVSGKETESPRGRIYLIRNAEEGNLSWTEDVRPHLDACLGCRACQTACPSGVEYGQLLELAREQIETRKSDRPKSALLGLMSNPSLLRLSLHVPGKRVPGLVSRVLSGQKPEADLPRPQPASGWAPLDESLLPPIASEVYLLNGCAMQVLFPRVHEATNRLLRRVGIAVRSTGNTCCGALHGHNGHLAEGAKMAKKLAAEIEPGIPLVTDSAGCGSFLKEEASRPVFDIAEFLSHNGLGNLLAGSAGLERTITYHDACHLVHGQGIRSFPRELLQAIPGVKYVELPEADMCCGSAGIYNITQPSMARQLLERKWQNVESTGAEVVASGNPGCHAWIEQASREHGAAVEVLHTVELLESSFSGLPQKTMHARTA
jgi:glycolate oxidase iron-sulfur subunit